MAENTVPSPIGEAAAARELTRSEENFGAPPVDIYEDERGLVVIADLPGVEANALDIGVERRVLTIHARASHLVSGAPLHREYELSGFYRQFQLPEEVDSARIEAELKNGVLFLRLPRTEQAQPRRIEVKTG
jgi:HSP20 family protein